ncbi:MAG: hypothetical protein HYY09_07300 [Firmicutes bacterium]|nr:hypothetical protein [Bacillota bacterium]
MSIAYRKFLVIGLILVLGVVMGTACGQKATAPEGGEKSSTPATGKKEEPKADKQGAKPVPKASAKPLVIAMGAEPATLDPYADNDGNMRNATANIFDSLVVAEAQSFNLKPVLATRWENEDPTTWRFWLRQGVKFHNGEPFNADAVVFSLKRILNKEYNSPLLNFFDGILEAKAVEPYVVDIITKGPNPLVPIRLSWLPIMEPKHVQAVGADVVEKPIGTGPYKFKQWNRGTQIVLERNEDYWDEKPEIPGVVVKFIAENSTRLMALQNNEVHIARDMSPEVKSQMPAWKDISGMEFSAIRLNAERREMKDKRIRQAMNYAVNKEALRDKLFNGSAKITPCQQSKSAYPGFNPDLKPYPFDVAKAKQLLQEAGYKGEKFEFVGARGRWLKDGELSEAVAKMLNDAGINVELKIPEWSKWVETYFNLKNPVDMILTSNSNEIGDQDLIMSKFAHTAGRSSTYHDDVPGLDKIIDDNRYELNIDKRNQVYRDLWAQLCEDPPWIFLLNPDDVYGVDPFLEWEPRQDQLIFVKDIQWKS